MSLLFLKKHRDWIIEQVNLEEECQSRVQWGKGRESERFSEVKKSGESVLATRVELQALEST